MKDIDLLELFGEKTSMKNLGVQPILIVYFTDNIQTKLELGKRCVYQKKDGTYWCNWFGGGQREVTKRKDGSFYWRIDVKTINAITGADLLKKLAGL